MSTRRKPKPARRILFSAEDSATRIRAIGSEISSDYVGRELLAVIVLRGAFIFGSDLIRHLDPTIRLHLDFLGVSSYGKGTVSTGIVRITQDVDLPIDGRNVLIIEDIVDTGRTVSTIRDHLLQRQPASLRIATLLQKKASQERKVELDYIGFEVPDDFVVGYGLDYDQQHRQLADIRILER